MESHKKGMFHIEDFDERYRLHNVEYNNGIYTVDWKKELLDSGKKHDQKDWLKWMWITDSEYKLPSMPLYHATIMALFENKEHPDDKQVQLVQKVREMFHKDFKQSVMMTGSKIRYKSKKIRAPKEIITHDLETKNERKVKGRFVGPHGYVKPGFADETIEAMLEARDLTMVEEAYEWIGEAGKKPYLTRFDCHPKAKKILYVHGKCEWESEHWMDLWEERPLTCGIGRAISLVEGFNRELNRFLIDAWNCPIISKPAHGVIYNEQKDGVDRYG